MQYTGGRGRGGGTGSGSSSSGSSRIQGEAAHYTTCIRFEGTGSSSSLE